MTRAVKLFKRSFSLLFLAGMMFVLSACSSAEASKQNNEYYEQLSKCTDTFLMKNRELKEISNSWNYKDKASTEKYINKLIEIEEIAAKTKNIDASENFIEFDKENVEEPCDKVLETVAITKALVQSAYDNRDDSDYQKVNEENSEIYNEAYDDVISSVATLRARIR